MREARLLLDWLETNQIFPNLSPVIVREEESDTTESSEDSRPLQSVPKPSSCSKPPILKSPEKQQQLQSAEVFSFNKPFLVQNQSDMSARVSQQRKQSGVEESQPSEPSSLTQHQDTMTAIPGIQRTGLVSISSVEDPAKRGEVLDQPIDVDEYITKLSLPESKTRHVPDDTSKRSGLVSKDPGEDKAQKEEILNRPIVVDDDVFKSRFLARQEQKKRPNESEKPCKSREETEVVILSHEEFPSGGVRPAVLNSSSEESDESKPPFFRNELYTVESQDVPPPVSLKTDVKEPKYRPVEEKKSSNLASLGLKKNKKIDKISSSGGESLERMKANQFKADENHNNPGKIDDTKLPKTWTAAKIVEVVADEVNDLPIFLIRTTKDSYFDTKLDPSEFEMTAPLDETSSKHFKKHLKGKIFVKRVGWIGEKSLNVVELKKVEDEGFDVDLASLLCRLGLLRKKTEQFAAASKVGLEEGALVYWRGFGKFSDLAKLELSREEDRQLLEAVMPATDTRKTLTPEPGQIVSIQDEEETAGPFLRAKILKVVRGRVLCQLLDEHERRICLYEELHPLPPAAWKIPPLAVEVRLDGVPARPRSEAREKCQPFREIIAQSILVVKIINAEENLIQLVGADGSCFNEILVEIIECKYDFTTTKVEPEGNEEEKEVENKEEKVVEKKVERKVENDLKKKDEKYLKIGERSLVGIGDDLNVELLTSYHTLALGQKITVRVLHFSSWSNFFVCAEAEYSQLERFQVTPLSSLIKYYNISHAGESPVLGCEG